MKFWGGALIAFAALSSCGAPSEDAEEAPAPDPYGGVNWEWSSGVDGATLALRGADGAELMRLTCSRNPPITVLDVPRFNPVAGAQPMSLAVDGAPFVFIARPSADGLGMHAEGATPPDLFDGLQRAHSVGAIYGEQFLGPYAPPERERIAEFTAACRPIPEQ
jgi:hypothetical protein